MKDWRAPPKIDTRECSLTVSESTGPWRSTHRVTGRVGDLSHLAYFDSRRNYVTCFNRRSYIPEKAPGASSSLVSPNFNPAAQTIVWHIWPVAAVTMTPHNRLNGTPTTHYVSRSKDRSIKISVDSLNSMPMLPILARWPHADVRKTNTKVSHSTFSPGGPYGEVTKPAPTGTINVREYKVSKKKRRTRDEEGGSAVVASLLKDGTFECPFTEPLEEKNPSTLTCEIQGHTFQGDNSPTFPATYMLGVLDRKTRAVRLVPFADMFPRMRWTARPAGSEDRMTPSPEPKDPKTSSGFSTPRTSQFSAKPKRKKTTERKEESFQTEMTGDVGEMIGFTTNDTDVDMVALMVQPKDADVNLAIGEEIRPRPRLEAERPEDLYDWSEISVPDSVLAAFFPLAEKVLAAKPPDVAKWRTARRFSPFFMDVLQKTLLGKKEAGVAEETRMASMLFINYLCELYELRDRPMREKDMLPAEVPAEAASYLIEHFTEPAEFGPGKRVVTSRCKDKLMARILLLVLHIEKYTADISTLISPLNNGKDRTRVENVAAICGAKFTAKVSKGKYFYSVTLKRPWQFPKMSTGNTPRKRKRV